MSSPKVKVTIDFGHHSNDPYKDLNAEIKIIINGLRDLKIELLTGLSKTHDGKVLEVNRAALFKRLQVVQHYEPEDMKLHETDYKELDKAVMDFVDFEYKITTTKVNHKLLSEKKK